MSGDAERGTSSKRDARLLDEQVEEAKSMGSVGLCLLAIRMSVSWHLCASEMSKVEGVVSEGKAARVLEAV